MKSLYLSGLFVLGCAVAGCGGGTTPSPSAVSSAMFTALLLPSSEVPPVTGSEANGSGTATVKFNLAKDSAGNITAATLDVTVSVTGFPSGTALIASHIHSGAASENGGVLVNFGLSPGEVSFATGTGSFTKQGVTLTVDQANSILANPAGFYLNIHTTANSGGVARGQLTRTQ
jgi:CHRD domain